jgi:hypothetical protein
MSGFIRGIKFLVIALGEQQWSSHHPLTFQWAPLDIKKFPEKNIHFDWYPHMGSDSITTDSRSKKPLASCRDFFV